MKGGYQSIDFKNVALSGTKKVVNGIYEAIEGNYGKATLLTGLNYGGTEKGDVFATITSASSKFYAVAHGYTIEINASDEVKITANSLTDAASIIAVLKSAGFCN